MEIIQQLQTEVSERASSPEGFLRFIRLLLKEVENIDVTSPNAPHQYFLLLRAYVLVKRQLAFFNKRCEYTMVDNYDKTFRSLKLAIKIKRDEARQYAARCIPPDDLKKLKRLAGTSVAIRQTELANIPRTLRHPYFGIHD